MELIVFFFKALSIAWSFLILIIIVLLVKDKREIKEPEVSFGNLIYVCLYITSIYAWFV